MRLVSQLGAEQRRVDESLAGDGERQRLQRREGRLRLPRRGQVARVLLGKRLEERVHAAPRGQRLEAAEQAAHRGAGGEAEQERLLRQPLVRLPRRQDPQLLAPLARELRAARHQPAREVAGIDGGVVARGGAVEVGVVGRPLPPRDRGHKIRLDRLRPRESVEEGGAPAGRRVLGVRLPRLAEPHALPALVHVLEALELRLHALCHQRVPEREHLWVIRPEQEVPHLDCRPPRAVRRQWITGR
mmetsp:Transcript_12367/g.39082  ORF Transcript_12367/g.39082 Transcript_12367/m.39082 type:complete len:244 (+) Transcript_12367:362-1093(+)